MNRKSSFDIASSFDEIVHKYSDPYIADWFLMDSILPALVISMLYIAFVFVGPRIMASRKPFDLRTVMIYYNLSITLLSAYMVYEYFTAAWQAPNFKWSCFPVDRTNDAIGRKLRRVSWLYFFSKFIELADTIIFILRKKQNQVSFLHVYHHTNLVILSWFGVRFVPTGETYFLAMLNSAIHVIMYFYYFMAAMGDAYKPYLWWKRYLTQMQLIQFVAVMSHYAYVYFAGGPSCDFPRIFLIGYTLNGLSFLVLFSHFYRAAYKVQRRSSKSIAADSETPVNGKVLKAN